MQLYFLKATYTNNVYKVSDFFSLGSPILNIDKMLDINFKPDDGLTSFITSKITLPDETSLRDHTHFIVSEYEKIYRIVSINYVNKEQWRVVCEEDPFIESYNSLQAEDLLITRTNDPDYFRGVHDINDLTLKETVETKAISSFSRTGKWALIFFQYNPDKTRYGLRFKNDLPARFRTVERFASLTDLTNQYPEVTTTTPQIYDYFQMIVFVVATAKFYQCVYDGSSTNTRLRWIEYIAIGSSGSVYFDLGESVQTKINQSDIKNIVIALPFETCLEDGSGNRLYAYPDFLGPIDSGDVIDIKIVDDLLFDIDTVFYTLTDRVMTKDIDIPRGGFIDTYATETGVTPIADYKLTTLFAFEKVIDLNPGYFSTTPSITDTEPFKKYDLYVFGKRFMIPYYLTPGIKMLIAMNSGVVNYLIYYTDKRNVIASGSFTHSARYKVDQLDAFYNQNPTYKEQFFTKMALDSMKTVAGGAIAGSVIPGLGNLGGLASGIAAAGVDAGISMINLGFMEKSLKLKPDQVFGENSEMTLQMINIFGIYWVKRTSENADLMKREYDLKGFPTLIYQSISDMSYEVSLFGTSKVIYGELKTIIKNNYVTDFINQKLKEGVVLIP